MCEREMKDARLLAPYPLNSFCQYSSQFKDPDNTFIPSLCYFKNSHFIPLTFSLTYINNCHLEEIRV